MGLLSHRQSIREKAGRLLKDGKGIIIPSAEGVRYYGSSLALPGLQALETAEQTVQLTHRNFGCEAILEDDGVNQKIPVCMGGLAIVGCNNPEQCGKAYVDRVNEPSYSHFFHVQENPKIINLVTTIPNGYCVDDDRQ